MTREEFATVAEEVLDSLPSEFQRRLQNVAILIEDLPPTQRRSNPGSRPRPRQSPEQSPERGPKRSQPQQLILGVFHGVPRTRKSFFDLPMGPDQIVLYQKNIEAVCSSNAEVREQIRLTIIHELGHYFGMDEDQLRHI